jgi:leader peptidase (prepilin peptidase)/N-methyltransferase
VFAVIAGVLGLGVGVLLALLAEAVPDKSGGGRSIRRCPTCSADVPIGSLLACRSSSAKCRACGERLFAARLPIVLVTGFTFYVIAAVVGPRWQLLPILVLSCSLITLSAVDMARYRLPDRLVFPSLGVSIVLIGSLSIINDVGDHVLRALLTGLGYATVLFVFNIVYPAGLAFGDVKLALLLGLFLGWSATNGIDAARLVVWALLIGMVLGIFSGLLVGLGRRAFGPGFLPDPDFPPAEDGSLDPLLKTAFPFGPALALSTLSLVVLSDQLLSSGSILA